MKRRRQDRSQFAWRSLALSMALALAAVAPLGAADEPPGASPPQHGVRGKATRRAVVKLRDAVRRDVGIPVIPGQPGAVPEPEAGPIPDFPPIPVPPESVGPMQPAEPLPQPQIPSPAAS